MGLYEFKMLSEQEQFNEVLNGAGIYLDNYLNGNQRFNLYALAMFFVEVEYNNATNKIVGLRAFKTGDLLDRYSNLDGIL